MQKENREMVKRFEETKLRSQNFTLNQIAIQSCKYNKNTHTYPWLLRVYHIKIQSDTLRRGTQQKDK